MTVRNAISGTLKWFDVAKGYGFIETDQSGADVLLHINVLRNYGRNSIAEGCRLTFSMREGQRGLAAVDIFSINLPLDQSYPQVEAGTEVLVFVPARIKWFCGHGRYGFVHLFEEDVDYFFGEKILKRGGLSEVQAGEAVAVAVDSDNGRNFVIAMRAWN